MATLFADYQRLVMQAYERNKADNTLPHGLMHLTPANLKDECVKKCTKEVNRRDEKIIRDFCGDLNESRSYYAIIQRCETDKFRPLVNYLKGKSEKTEVKNIELLAWLIGFSGRPWEMGKEYSGDVDIEEDVTLNKDNSATEDQVLISAPQVNEVATGSDQPARNPRIPEILVNLARIDGAMEKESADVKTIGISDEKEKKGRAAKRLVAAVILSLALGTGSMWWWKEKNRELVPQGCMYWLEDHYEPVKCDQKIPNSMIIALDTMKLKKFRRIMRPDTISYEAIGKVWYLKIGGGIEYYTSGGTHPVAFNRQLRPITIYIIDKYILSQKNN
ncbi:hypothetical protein [Chitinophaga sp. S165]|uniref:hypothetical protein n=1 Tax=Chitinophaga sp. S165 TaxID=2135462 RepID=UPI000D712B86|nr:hypothetical protein [Chitinophaga sp. S165]PWV54454.1 hypothetical protein C7475_1021213 [Chitinophaga sp. S165]